MTDSTAATFATFEAQLERLQTIVKALDNPSVPLAEMLALYSEGMTLAQTCRRILDNASQRISEIGRSEIDCSSDDVTMSNGASPTAVTDQGDGLPF